METNTRTKRRAMSTMCLHKQGALRQDTHAISLTLYELYSLVCNKNQLTPTCKVYTEENAININLDYTSATIYKHQRCMTSVYTENNQVHKQTQLQHSYSSIPIVLTLHIIMPNACFRPHTSAYSFIRIFIIW